MDLANTMKNLHRMIYESGDQGQRVLDYLNGQRKNQPSFCDSVLKIRETEIRGHRCVLAVTIPKLADSLKHKGSKTTTTIELQGLDPGAVEALVEYSYTSRLNILPEDVGNVYFAAKNLEMKEIEIATEKFILDNILPLDWLSVRSFGEQNNCPKFIAAADKFIEQNMEVIYRKKEFFRLPRLQVELAATHSNRQESFDPKVLCESAISWVQKEVQEGESSLRNILEQTHIIFMQPDGQLKECKPEDLDSTSEVIATDAQKEYIRYNSTEQLAKASTPSDDEGICENNNEKKRRSSLQEKEFRLIAAIHSGDNGYAGVGIMGGMLVAISIFSAPQFSCANSSSSESSGYDDWSLITPMSRGRCSVGAVAYGSKLFAIGGYDRGDCLQMVECYDPQTNEWMPTGQLMCQRGRFGVAILDDNFYAIGGSDGHKELNTGESYDAKSNTWSSIPSMKSCRSSFGMGVVDGCIYAIGGFQGQTNWKSAEKFNPSTMEWSKVSPMSTERNNLCVEALDGKLYAVGGYNGWTCFNSVECYDPRTEHWSFIKPMKTARRGAGCAAVNGCLYVIGGSDGTKFLSSVECYNPETCEWTMVASMNAARHNVGVAVMGELIYVVGGFDGLSFLNTIECYDAKADKWTTFIHSQ